MDWSPAELETSSSAWWSYFALHLEVQHHQVPLYIGQRAISIISLSIRRVDLVLSQNYKYHKPDANRIYLSLRSPGESPQALTSFYCRWLMIACDLTVWNYFTARVTARRSSEPFGPIPKTISWFLTRHISSGRSVLRPISLQTITWYFFVIRATNLSISSFLAIGTVTTSRRSNITLTKTNESLVLHKQSLYNTCISQWAWIVCFNSCSIRRRCRSLDPKDWENESSGLAQFISTECSCKQRTSFIYF